MIVVWILITVLLGLFVLWTFVLIYRRWKHYQQWKAFRNSDACACCGHSAAWHCHTFKEQTCNQ